jgi:outer membrane protein insertion porin family
VEGADPDAVVPPGTAPQPAPIPAPRASPAGDLPAAEIPGETTAPALLLREYVIEGNLLEDVTIVRGFFDGMMPLRQPWNDEAQRLVTEFAAHIGYHLSLRNEPLDGGGVRAILNLQPVTLVRRIDVKISKRGDLIASVLGDPVFAEDITRHMRLRPGSPMALDEASRAGQLKQEQERVFDFLKDEGFFEARVRITAVPDGPHAVELKVNVVAGPGYRVGRVRVVGNREIPGEEIAALFHHKRLRLFPRRFSREQLKEDLDEVAALYHKRGFPGVRVSTDFGPNSFKRDRKRVDFTVVVRERRRVEVYFEGNKNVGEQTLRGGLTLVEQGSYDDVEVERGAQAIRRIYQSKGYFEVNVLWERVSFRLPEQLFDRIVFTIDEGPRLRVREVEFVGNRALSATALRDVIKTRVYPKFDLIQSGGHATSVQLDEDVERIAEAYRVRGYADVQVVYDVARDRRLVGHAPALAAAIVADLPAEGLYVRFHIEEGPRQRVERVLLDFGGGRRHASERALRRELELRRGDSFTEALATADTNRIKRFYFERGYPHAQIATTHRKDCRGAYDPDRGCLGEVVPDRILVVHQIRPGPAVRIGKIALRGNFRTRGWVLREQLELREGAPFTAARVGAAQRGLNASGLFSAANLDFVGYDRPTADVINVLVRVEEQFDHLFEFGLGGGYSTEDGFFVDASVLFPNIRGVGIRAAVNAQLGSQVMFLEGKLTLPQWIPSHYLGLKFLIDMAASIREEETERFGILNTQSVTAAASREGRVGTIWQGWFVALRYTLRQRNRQVELVRPSGASDDIDRVPVKTRTGSLGPELVVDKRRDARKELNPLAPVSGVRAELSALVADQALGGDATFLKVGFKAQHYLAVSKGPEPDYLRVGPRLLLTNALRYDQGIPLGGSVLLPEVERFFAGGDTTVRGFEQDRLLTEIIEEDVPPIGGLTQFSVRPAGGNIRFIHNIDLQLRVWDKSVLFGLPWASAVFLDTGLVTNSLADFEARDLRHALGIAFLRLLTPLVSVSLEWALPLDPQLGDNPRGRFHLNLGFVLR